MILKYDFLFIFVIIFKICPINGLIQVKNISAIYIKGEERQILHLDEFFKGNRINYIISHDSKFINFRSGITELQSLIFITPYDLAWKTSVLRQISENSHVFVVQYNNKIVQEFTIIRTSMGTYSLYMQNADPKFKNTDHCFLYANNRPPLEIIIRCMNNTKVPKYDSYSKKVGSKQYQKWNEIALRDEDLENPNMQFLQDISAVLSKDKMEQRLYLYLMDKQENVYVNTEIFSMRNYNLKHNFTNFVLSKPHSFVIYHGHNLCIYKQQDYVGTSILLSNLTIPFNVDSILYNSQNEPDSVYLYNKKDCHILRVNVADKYWPHIDSQYNYEDSNFVFNHTNVIVSKNFVICMGYSNTNMISKILAYNKENELGQSLAGIYDTNIQEMQSFLYQNDTFLQVDNNYLKIIKLNARLLEISTLQNPVKEDLFNKINVTVLDGKQKMSVFVDTYILPQFSNKSFVNENKSTSFYLLAGEKFETDFDGYVLGGNESYIGIQGKTKLNLELVDKLKDVTFNTREIRQRKKSNSNLKYKPSTSCLLFQEFNISVTDKLIITVKQDKFEIKQCREVGKCFLQRIIALENNSDLHCVINNKDKRLMKGGSYHIYQDRYFIFISQDASMIKYLNVIDLYKTNINNYYSIAKLDESEYLDINSYYMYFDSSAKPPIITITSAIEMLTYYQFELNTMGLLTATAPYSEQRIEKYELELIHVSGKRIPLEFRVHSENLGVKLIENNTEVIHRYKNGSESFELDMGKYVEGYNVTLYPIIDNVYSFDYSKIKINQQVTYLKEITTNGFGWNIKFSTSNSINPLITLSDNLYNMLNISFYSLISTSPFIKEKPFFRVLTDTQMYTVKSLGPTIILENSTCLVLYTYDMVGNDGYALKFVSLKHRAILSTSLPFSFALKTIAYNIQNQYLILLEETPNSFYSNSLYIKFTNTVNRFYNNFDRVITVQDAGMDSWTVSQIDTYLNLIVLGVKNYGLILFTTENGYFELFQKIKFLEESHNNEFEILSIKFLQTENSIYLIGHTNLHIFVYEYGTKYFQYTDSYLKPSIYISTNITAIYNTVFAVLMQKNEANKKQIYTIVFYKFNEDSKILEMKFVLNTENIVPISINFLYRPKEYSKSQLFFMITSYENGVELYKIYLDPEIVISPNLGENTIKIEVQNTISTKNFTLKYIPIKEYKTKMNVLEILFICISVIVFIVGIGILIYYLIQRHKAKIAIRIIPENSFENDMRLLK